MSAAPHQPVSSPSTDTCSPARPSRETSFTRSVAKYAGFALLLSWHYVFWFVPSIFSNVQLMDDCVTYSWLVNLFATAVFAFLIGLALGRKRHLSHWSALFAAAPLLLAAGTLTLALLPYDKTPAAIWYAASIALGALEAILWILWGEHFACEKAQFSITHIGTAFGVTLLTTVLVADIIPDGITPYFAALLPLASGALLIAARRRASDTFPVLLPAGAASAGVHNMIMVGCLTLFATAACYFLVAIIPWEELPTRDRTFTIGIMVGAAFMLLIAGSCALSKGRLNVFKIFPTLFVLEIIAFALFLSSRDLFLLSFDIGTGLSAIFEILLIMYFGILITKGYVTAALGFACSCGFARLGKGLGNTLAVSYEHMPEVAAAITPETALFFMCLLACLIIPLVRREYSIVALTTIAPTKSEIEQICAEAAQEFGLSSREEDVLLLIARGYTAKAIADKLVLSAHTVNTHIRHIYDKMQIHKRSELLNYLNMQRSDY